MTTKRHPPGEGEEDGVITIGFAHHHFGDLKGAHQSGSHTNTATMNERYGEREGSATTRSLMLYVQGLSSSWSPLFHANCVSDILGPDDLRRAIRNDTQPPHGRAHASGWRGK